MKKERGITLIALIITIVVILILVGVTISITLGENGIIQKSKEASSAQTASQGKETSELTGAGVEGKIDAIVNGTGTQTISTRLTQGGGGQVYICDNYGVEYYCYENVFYRNYNGNWYYDEPSDAEELPEYVSEDIKNELDIDNIPANTFDYLVHGALRVVKIDNIWYTYGYIGNDSSTFVFNSFEPVDFDSSIFEGAVDFDNYEESGS